MSYHNFVADSTHAPGHSPTDKLSLIGTGTWGSGTISIQVYDDVFADWQEISSKTANFAIEAVIGKGRQFRFVLTGATGPDLDITWNKLQS